MAILKKYEFAAQSLRAQIGKRYEPGDALPPEAEMARSLGVSMFTLRRAIEPLVREGLLIRQQGKRTVVAPADSAVAARPASVLLISLDQTPFFYDEAVELQKQLFEGGLNTQVCNATLRKDADLASQFRDILNRHTFDAVVCGPASVWIPTVLPVFEETGRPFVFFKTRGPIEASFVTVDLASAACEALRHLERIGCRSVRCFVNPDERGAYSKIEGIRRYLNESRQDGSVEDVIAPAVGWTESGYEAALREFTAGRVPDGVLAHNDFCAIGVLMAAHKMGIRVPEDLAIIGFDGMASVEDTKPPLSTMEQPKQQIALEVVRMLKRRLESPLSPVREQIVLQAHLAARESTLGFARAFQRGAAQAQS